MRSTHLGRTLAFLAAAGLLAACGDGTSPAPRVVTVDSLLADVSSIESYSAFGAALGGMPAAPSFSPSSESCVFTAATQNFVCSPVTTGGITMSRSYQLLDASGAAMSAFNPATVAAIRTVSDVSGTTTLAATGSTPSLTVALTSHTDQTLSGLLTATRTMNGTGTMSSTLTSQGTSTTFAGTQKVENLVLPQRGSATPYPASGKITVETTFPALVGAGVQTVKVVMTYNGTAIVTMSITAAGITTTCTMDMSKPSTAPSCTGG